MRPRGAELHRLRQRAEGSIEPSERAHLKIRAALPFVADVFIDVTASRAGDESAGPSVSPGKG